jgi:hypothetical protein
MTFKIPTILGLGIIFLGIATGVYLVLHEQTFLSQAVPNLTPQDITFTNITEDSVVVSWQTQTPAVSFISFGQNNLQEQTNLDDRDANAPKPHLTHYTTLKNLPPQTSYQFKITSGKKLTDILKFKTAQPTTTQTGFTPVIGSVLDGDTTLSDGIAYLSISGANTQSSLIKLKGNFLIPISQIRKEDLSDIFPLTEDMVAKLTIISDKGRATALFKLRPYSKPLPPLILGQDVDLTPSAEELTSYDLNSDGKINAADNAIILDVINKKTTNKKADLNKDGKVDQKDLDLMAKQINK